MSVNTRPIPAGRALEALRAGWQAQCNAGLSVSYMLHGRPGVGKTQIVQQLADEIGARLFDLRLTTIEPQDLRGLPYFDHERGRTVWYRPEDLPDDPAAPAILFLDELTAAAPTLQPAVYGLLQERRVGPHKLPDSVLVIGAGNTAEDGAVAYEIGTALSDRLVHLMVVANAADWLDHFAIPQDLAPEVIAFIRTRPDLLETSVDALSRGDVIAATPRSWERVSDLMRAGIDQPTRAILIAGTVGEAIAAEFNVIAEEIAATVQVHEMLETPADLRWALYPDTLHGLNALIYGLIGATEAGTIGPVTEIMTGIGDLAARRSEATFQTLPLAELRTYAFEILIGRALDKGLGEAMLAAPAYQRYAAARADA
ncbi:MAG: MoxR family ATPase [Pseudomonadota bacterium]